MRLLCVTITVLAMILMTSAVHADYTISGTSWGDVSVIDANLVNTLEADGGTDWAGPVDSGAFASDQYDIRATWGGKPSQALYAICVYPAENPDVEELVTTVTVPDGDYNVFLIYGSRSTGDTPELDNTGVWARMTGSETSTFYNGANGEVYEVTPDTFDGYIALVGQQSGTQLTMRAWTSDENGANPIAVEGRLIYLGVGYAAVPEPGSVVLLASGLFGLLAYAWRKRK